jgi:enamine deaminase RidA (YjgF/YER057c/UK114 family)
MKYMLIFVAMLFACFQSRAQVSASHINPFTTKPTGYTHVVVAGKGKIIFISGQVALNDKGEVVGKGDLEKQTFQVFENLQTCLKAAGASFKEVVKMTTYVKDYKPEQVPIIRKVRSNYLPADQPPASTLIGVQSLVNPDLLIEIEAIAVIPE